MPISAIVQVLCRLLSLHWLLVTILPVFSLVMLHNQMTEAGISPSEFGRMTLGAYGAVLIQTVGVVALWFAAPAISRFVTKGIDSEVNLGGLTLGNLYAVVLLGIGIYVTFGTLPRLIPELMRFSNMAETWSALETGDRDHSIRQMYENARNAFLAQFVPFVAGIVLVITSKKWAAHLGKSPVIDSGKGDREG